MTPAMCSKQYKEVWDETHKPDPINTTMTTLEEVSQLCVHNKELMSRVASIEENIAAGGGLSGDGDGEATSTSISTSEWYDNCIIDTMIKPIMILTAISGLKISWTLSEEKH
jgi:hypothetical protein